MQNRGSTIAMVLAGLALVVAASGTAYAVTATTVKIADPSTPANVARVDASGHLRTAGPLSTIDSVGYVTNYASGLTYLTSPTTASLVISRLRLSDPSTNSTYTVQLELGKVSVTTSGNCGTGVTTPLGFYDLASGDSIIDAFPAPVVVKPTGGAKYCLALDVTVALNSSSLNYYPSYSLTAYVYSGSYTGAGTPLVRTNAPSIARVRPAR